MTKTIENLFIYTAVYSALLPFLLFFLFYIKTKQQGLLQIVILYSFIEFITNFTSFYLSVSVIRILYSAFTVIEYLLFAYCFYTLIKSPFIRKGIIYASLLYFIFAIFYFLLTKYKTLDSVPIGVETVLILIYAFYNLYEEMDSPSQILIYNKYQFWIVGGIIMYLAGCFFIYIFANQVDAATFRQYWMFTNIFTTLKNVLFSISILVFLKQRNQTSLKKHYTYSN
ncbi:MAG: hypothetical protein JWP69_1517 [Flaviaesturariibacter sp.]|nr:hypothetical protein [Flaviaesturariibacter sp.]